MFLADFNFVISHLKIHPAVHLTNTLKALLLQSKREVYKRFTSFHSSYVPSHVRKR